MLMAIHFDSFEQKPTYSSGFVVPITKKISELGLKEKKRYTIDSCGMMWVISIKK